MTNSSVFELEQGLNLNLDFTKIQQIAHTAAQVIPVIVQDAASKQVLLLAYTNEAAFQQTLQTKIATFWSTSRNQLWVKGKTSGDYLAVQQIKVNCEQNSLLYLVQPQGQGACHTKDPQGKPHATCYYRQVINSQQLKLDAL